MLFSPLLQALFHLFVNLCVFVCSLNAAGKKRSEGKSATSDGHEIQFGLRD